MNGYEYVYGSTAKKKQEREKEQQVNRIHRKKIRIKKFKKSKRKIIAYTIICFAIFLFIMVRYAAMLNLNYNISEKEAQYERLLAENSALNMEINKKTNLSAIYDRAVNELGMIEASSDNVAYYDIDRNDKKILSKDYVEEMQLERKDPVTGMIEKIRLFLNIK